MNIFRIFTELIESYQLKWEFICCNSKVHHIYFVGKIFIDKCAVMMMMVKKTRIRESKMRKNRCFFAIWSNSKLRKMLHPYKIPNCFLDTIPQSEFRCSSAGGFFLFDVNIFDSTINHLIGNWFKNCIRLASNDKNTMLPEQQQAKIIYLAFRRTINNW